MVRITLCRDGSHIHDLGDTQIRHTEDCAESLRARQLLRRAEEQLDQMMRYFDHPFFGKPLFPEDYRVQPVDKKDPPNSSDRDLSAESSHTNFAIRIAVLSAVILSGVSGYYFSDQIGNGIQKAPIFWGRMQTAGMDQIRSLQNWCQTWWT